MNITLLDKEFIPIRILDAYTSFIWTDRYREFGDFEFYAPMDKDLYSVLDYGMYLTNDESEHVMIVETIEVTTNVDEGDFLRVKGRSLESLLDRRIVWEQYTCNTKLYLVVQRLIERAFIPGNKLRPRGMSARGINNFTYTEDWLDDYIKGLNLQAQYYGETIYDIIADLAADHKFGFKITLDANNNFVFGLYNGKDLYETVIFSNEFNNLIDTDVINSYTKYKNVGLVAGEGEGTSRKTAIVGAGTGLDRREMFIEASGISTRVKGDEDEQTSDRTIDDAEYKKLLIQHGKEKLAEVSKVKEFNGEIEPDVPYIYRQDYNIGDIIRIIDRYGNDEKARIDEMIFSHDSNEYKRYPTFTIQEQEDEE